MVPQKCECGVCSCWVLTFFMPGKIWTPVLQNLDCGLRCPGYGAWGVQVLLPGCSSQPMGSSCRARCQDQSGVWCSMIWLLSAGLVLLSPEVCMQSLPALVANEDCDVSEKHRINFFSQEAFFLFLFSSWDPKKRQREGNTEEFYTLFLETLELMIKSGFSLKDLRVCCLLPFFHLLPWTDWWITEHCETREQTLGSWGINQP